MSDVEGDLIDAISWSDIFRAVSPPGSVSGAPKSSALSTISENENPRGPYCGALGWVQGDQAELSVATPFLVLHDEQGLPVALISLADLSIIDYSTTPPATRMSDPEHQTLVQEFRDEYLELVQSSGDQAFTAGLLFPAIPLWIEKGIGVDIVKRYIEELN